MKNYNLEKINITDNEVFVYETLLGLGEVPASQLVPETGLKRATVYRVLDELIDKKLVEKDESEPVVKFRAKHPYAVKNYIESEVQEIKNIETRVDGMLPNLVSLYHQSQTRPGVRFYEGKEGIKKALDDSLTSKTEILTIVDIEAIRKYIFEINEKYTAKRNKLQVPKRLLVNDTPYARERMKGYSEHTDAKLFNLEISPFSTGMQIYDNKVVYITMTDQILTATIIQDPQAYSMQKALFDFIWKHI